MLLRIARANLRDGGINEAPASLPKRRNVMVPDVQFQRASVTPLKEITPVSIVPVKILTSWSDTIRKRERSWRARNNDPRKINTNGVSNRYRSASHPFLKYKKPSTVAETNAPRATTSHDFADARKIAGSNPNRSPHSGHRIGSLKPRREYRQTGQVPISTE